MEYKLNSRTNLRIKYLFDRFVALSITILLLPLGILIIASIIIESFLKGEPPQIFVSEKRRSAGHIFPLLKFRIFRVSSLRQHQRSKVSISVKALEKPEHLTWSGKWMKPCYLDELPQLINILRGEMSLVGPRPYFDGDWQREPLLDIPARRFLKAGLVGPFQAVKGQVSGLDSVNAIDTEYFDFIMSASFSTLMMRDIKIIQKSFFTSMRAEGL
jgi:lipopolysaccharide/colanic/teichoic acid biosynthesis glycosyltransferase